MNIKLLIQAFLFSGFIMTTYYADAQFQWAATLGGTNNDKALSLCLDQHGNVFTTGVFEGSADFDPGSGSVMMTSLGGKDIFITKVDSSGILIWAIQIGGLTGDNGNSITNDSNGNIYLSGSFTGTVDFDPGVGVFNLTTTGSSAYILKLDNQGNFLWVKQIKPSPGLSSGSCIKLDNSKNIYLTGIYQGTVDFNTGSGVFNLYSNGLFDMFITKLDSNGNFIWANGIGSTYKTYGNALDVDQHGNVYTIGNFTEPTDMDPGPGTNMMTLTSGQQTFILKLDSLGQFIWAKQFQSASINSGSSIDLDPLGNILTTGNCNGISDFDPGIGVFNPPAVGTYISKLDSSGNFIWAKIITGIGYSITSDNVGDVYCTGHFSCSCDFDPGPGSFIMESNANQLGAYLIKLNAAGNFVWAKPLTGVQIGSNAYSYCVKTDNQGNVYTCGEFEDLIDFDPGYVVHNKMSAGNIDGFVHKFQECTQGYYTMNAIACDFFVLNGFVYGLQGTYHQVLQSASGCDSIVTLYLTLHTINNAITLTGNTLQAVGSGLNYQWIICPINVIIPGATNQTFSPINNGNYAVIVSSTTCIDTSICIPVTGIANSTTDLSFQHSLQLTPNPIQGEFSIQSNEILNDATINIFDMTGQCLFHQQHFKGSSFQYDLSKQANGFYFITLNDQGKHANFKLVKE